MISDIEYIQILTQRLKYVKGARKWKHLCQESRIKRLFPSGYRQICWKPLTKTLQNPISVEMNLSTNVFSLPWSICRINKPPGCVASRLFTYFFFSLSASFTKTEGFSKDRDARPEKLSERREVFSDRFAKMGFLPPNRADSGSGL